MVVDFITAVAAYRASARLPEYEVMVAASKREHDSTAPAIAVMYSELAQSGQMERRSRVIKHLALLLEEAHRMAEALAVGLEEARKTDDPSLWLAMLRAGSALSQVELCNEAQLRIGPRYDSFSNDAQLRYWDAIIAFALATQPRRVKGRLAEKAIKHLANREVPLRLIFLLSSLLLEVDRLWDAIDCARGALASAGLKGFHLRTARRLEHAVRLRFLETIRGRVP